MQHRTFLCGSAAIVAGPLFSTDAFAEQPTKLPLIGFLSATSPALTAPLVAAFLQGLRETGYGVVVPPAILARADEVIE